MLDDVAGPLAGAIGEHLFVGEHGLASGTPVHRRLAPVGEAGLEEPQENELVEAHVVGVVAPHLSAPVVNGAKAEHARPQFGDARLGVLAGVLRTPLDRGILGREPERVEPEGREHGVPLHRPEPDEHVPEGVVADVALVGGSARVGVHREHVVGRAGVVEVDFVRALLGPASLPAGFSFLGVVVRPHRAQTLPSPGGPTANACARVARRALSALSPVVDSGEVVVSGTAGRGPGMRVTGHSYWRRPATPPAEVRCAAAYNRISPVSPGAGRCTRPARGGDQGGQLVRR